MVPKSPMIWKTSVFQQLKELVWTYLIKTYVPVIHGICNLPPNFERSSFNACTFLNQNYVPGIHGTYVAKRFLQMYVNTFTSSSL